MIRDTIINNLGIEAQGVKASGFPLEVFPQKLQTLTLDLIRSEDYLVEYICSAMLSVASTAIGNSHQICVRGEWLTNPSLYMVLVGRPGLGKTPPLKFLMKPLYDIDDILLEKFRLAYKEYEQKKASKKNSEEPVTVEEPVLVQNIVNDFTPEALWRTHDSNKRGVIIHVDEIMGMFNTVNRYSNGNLIEQLLSAFSGSPLKVSRLSSPVPLSIQKPCINIIGTIQTKRINELYDKGYEANGLLDRFIFVKPVKQTFNAWEVDEDNRPGYGDSLLHRWDSVILNLVSLSCNFDEKGNPVPATLQLSTEAKHKLYGWRNDMMNRIDAIENDSEVDSRIMKRPLIAAKIALVMQLLRWACDESHKDFIDEKSVEGAISLIDYYEDSFSRIKADLANMTVGDRDTRFLSGLADVFTTHDAVNRGADFNIGDRAVKKLLNRLVGECRIIRIKQGYYEKVKKQSVSVQNEPSAQCTRYTEFTKGTENTVIGNEMKRMNSASGAQSCTQSDTKEGVDNV